MTIDKITQLQENIDEIRYQFDVFINDEVSTGKEFRRLLKESESLIHQIEEDVWDGLIAKSFYEEAKDLRPRRELDFSTRAFDLTADHTKGIKNIAIDDMCIPIDHKGIKKTSKGDIGWI